MPPRVNIYQAYAWVAYRSAEAVATITTTHARMAAAVYKAQERVAREDELWNALRRGDLCAVGRKPFGPIEEIPSFAWESHRERPNGYQDVSVDSRDLLATWKSLDQPGGELYSDEKAKVESWYQELRTPDGSLNVAAAYREIAVRWERTFKTPRAAESTIKGWLRAWRDRDQPSG